MAGRDTTLGIVQSHESHEIKMAKEANKSDAQVAWKDAESVATLAVPGSDTQPDEQSVKIDTSGTTSNAIADQGKKNGATAVEASNPGRAFWLLTLSY
jgi:hypothetical protein